MVADALVVEDDEHAQRQDQRERDVRVGGIELEGWKLKPNSVNLRPELTGIGI